MLNDKTITVVTYKDGSKIRPKNHLSIVSCQTWKSLTSGAHRAQNYQGRSNTLEDRDNIQNDFACWEK